MKRADGDRVAFTFDGQALSGRRGQTLVAALWAAGIRSLRRSARTGEPRGLWCGIGHCYECRVTVGGVHGVRSCLIHVREGMEAAPEPVGEAAPSAEGSDDRAD